MPTPTPAYDRILFVAFEALRRLLSILWAKKEGAGW